MAVVLGDAKLNDLMPKSMLDSDDDLDTSWSSASSDISATSESGSAESGSGGAESPTSSSANDAKSGSDYSIYEDYFGLTNLVHNIKISDDNPLLKTTSSSSSDILHFNRDTPKTNTAWSHPHTATLSTMLNHRPTPAFEKRGLDTSEEFNLHFPPPSMRMSKSMRDHIINGTYQESTRNFHRTNNFLPVHQHQQQQQQQPQQQPQQQQQQQQQQQRNFPHAQDTQQQHHGRSSNNGVQVCVFCRNNGEAESVYTSHVLKDTDGRTSCPILRAYTCPICKSNGDHSHTIKYCPMNHNNRFAPAPVNGFVPPHVAPPNGVPHPPHGIGHRNFHGHHHGGF